MSQKRISKGMILGLAYLLAEGISQIMLVPLITHAYGPEKAGLWFLINNFLVLIQIGQAGLGPAAIRGLASVAHQPIRIFNEEYSKVTSAYRLALALFLLMLFAVTFYIEEAAAGQPHWTTLWCSFAAGLAARMYAWKWLNAVNALGNVGLDKLVMVLGVFFSTTAYLALIVHNQPIAMLGAAYGTLGLIHLILCKYLYKSVIKHHSKAIFTTNLTVSPRATRPSRHYLVIALPFVILNISGFFVMNFDVIVAERLFGTAIVARYFILTKLGLLLLSVSTLYQQMSYPFIAAAWSQKNFTAASQLYRKGLTVSLTVAISGSITMLLAAPYVVPLWLGPNTYLGPSVFAAQLLFVIVSTHTIAHALPALATSQVSFVDLAVISAVAAVPMTYGLGLWIGLPGIGLGGMLATIIPSYIHAKRSRRVFNHDAFRLETKNTENY